MCQSNKRIEWIDSAKGLAIFLVILGHCITRMGGSTLETFIRLFIYSFHMPLFFILSGYNLKLDSGISFVRKKAMRVFLPGIFFSSLFFFCCEFFKLSDIAGRFNSATVIDTLLFTNKSVFSNYWFFTVLFSAQLIWYFLVTHFSVSQIFVILSALCVISKLSFRYFSSFASPLGFLEAFYAVTFLFIGYYFKRNPTLLNRLLQPKYIFIYVFLSLSGNFYEFLHNNLTMDMYNGNIHNIFLYFINALAGSFICIFISKWIISFRFSIYLCFLGRNSLWIYGLHYIFLELLCKINNSLSPFPYFIYNFIKNLINAFLILFLCLLTIFLSNCIKTIIIHLYGSPNHKGTDKLFK